MTKIFSEVRRLPEFERDYKKLKKKFRTLDEDFDTFVETQLKLFHKLGVDNGGCVRISDIGIERPQIYKVLKFACKALKGRGSKSGIRITYTYYPDEDVIEFIEIYFKGDKSREGRDRILRIYGQ